MVRNDTHRQSSYYPNMPRKTVKPQTVGPDWFLVEWMRTLRVTQAKLAAEAGWSKATMNDIYHGRTSYYREIVNDAARALKIAPHELLMPPEEAMNIRRMREDAIRIAADAAATYRAPEPTPMRAASGR